MGWEGGCLMSGCGRREDMESRRGRWAVVSLSEPRLEIRAALAGVKLALSWYQGICQS